MFVSFAPLGRCRTTTQSTDGSTATTHDCSCVPTSACIVECRDRCRTVASTSAAAAINGGKLRSSRITGRVCTHTHTLIYYFCIINRVVNDPLSLSLSLICRYGRDFADAYLGHGIGPIPGFTVSPEFTLRVMLSTHHSLLINYSSHSTDYDVPQRIQQICAILTIKIIG